MLRQSFITAASIALLTAATTAFGQTIGETLILEDQAARFGLSRGWFAQLPVDRARTKIKSVTLQADLLLAVSTEGVLYVVDAETGQLKWSIDLVESQFQTLHAAASATHVAVVNDTQLYVMDRGTGAIVLSRELTGTPATGPVLLAEKVAVPLVHGPLEVYPLDVPPSKIVHPEYLASFSPLVGAPAVSGDRLLWTEAARIQGRQFAAAGTSFNERIPGDASSGPAVFPPSVYVGTQSGYVTAFDAERGIKLWSFAAGSAVYEQPIAIGSVVYVLPQDGGMFAVKADSGEELWYTPDPARFVSATATSVYTIDRWGRLTIVDARSGALVDRMALVSRLEPLSNGQTDRLYLYTDSGLIQCLHEAGLTEPHRWSPNVPEAKPKPPAPDETPPSEAAPAAGA